MERRITESMTIDEFVEWEANQPERWEFAGGEVWAMTGGTVRHNRIAGNLYAALSAGVEGGPCIVLINDVKLHAAGAHFYPDLMVTCSAADLRDPSASMVSEPTVVIEVLSPSTAARDRGIKLEAYCAIPSVREYVLVDPARRVCEVYARSGTTQARTWIYRRIEPGESLRLESLGIDIVSGVLWRGLADAAGNVEA